MCEIKHMCVVAHVCAICVLYMIRCVIHGMCMYVQYVYMKGVFICLMHAMCRSICIYVHVCVICMCISATLWVVWMICVFMFVIWTCV